MPKKFDGENSKVAAARARKEGAKVAERQQKEAAKEEELWKDDDKNVQKKLLRKDEKEKKKMEQAAKKATLKSLADQELESIKVESKQAPSKITRLQIQVKFIRLLTSIIHKKRLLFENYMFQTWQNICLKSYLYGIFLCLLAGRTGETRSLCERSEDRGIRQSHPR